MKRWAHEKSLEADDVLFLRQWGQKVMRAVIFLVTESTGFGDLLLCKLDAM